MNINELAFSSVDPISLSVSILTSLFFSSCLAYVYTNFWSKSSNLIYPFFQFILLSITITVVISIIKSSLALSLGLVGALSIVRFRTAIKEPTDLIFYFICIAIGLGSGSGQISTTIIGSMTMIILIYIFSKIDVSKKLTNYTVFISSDKKIDVVSKLNHFLEDQNYEIFDYHIMKNSEEIKFKIKTLDKNFMSKIQSFLNQNNLTAQFTKEFDFES